VEVAQIAVASISLRLAKTVYRSLFVMFAGFLTDIGLSIKIERQNDIG
jgi:hypothetical protein